MFLEIFKKKIDRNEPSKNLAKDLKNALNKERNQTSVLEKIEKETKLTVNCRDKMYVERTKILRNIYTKSSIKDGMYYVYSMHQGGYLINNLQTNTKEIIKAFENELPAGAGVDSILRKENGKYILDIELTNEAKKQMEEMCKILLEEQKEEIANNRIEGHIYEFCENSNDRVLLLDTNLDDKMFDELEFPSEFLDSAEEGNLYIYKDGKYQIYE